jgi:hypothetical protein
VPVARKEKPRKSVNVKVVEEEERKQSGREDAGVEGVF